MDFLSNPMHNRGERESDLMFWLIVTVVVLIIVVITASICGDKIYDAVHKIVKEFTGAFDTDPEDGEEKNNE